MGLLSRSRKESKTNQAPATSSSKWATSFLNAASTVRASAEAGMTKLGSEISQKLQIARDGVGLSSSGSSNGNAGQVEECPQCGAKFSSVTTLVDHVEKVHERNNQSRVFKMSIDVCPKCSKGFRDPVALVEHVERDHGGTSKA